MKSTSNWGTKFGRATAIGLTLVACRVSAQLPQIHPTLYGSAQFDSKHTRFYLLGLYAGVSGLGWTPYANINEYNLIFRNGTKNQTLWAFSPTLGLAYNKPMYGVSFGAGYAWVNRQGGPSVNTQQGGKNGVTTSFGLHSTGEGDRPVTTQLLANYNFGARYLWGRARLLSPLGYSTMHPATIGLEFVGQGGGRPVTSNSFSVGPVLGLKWTPKFSTSLSAGAKFNGTSGNTASNTAAYVNLEFSISP